MKSFTKEFWVGSLFLLVVGLMLVFGWLMGVLGPFRKEASFQLLYSFAGGVEVGSPVRVSGVKVGKVEKIEFLPTGQNTDDPVTLRLTVSVSKKASPSIRKDSKFYVNMAGIIGERYIEISPGSPTELPLETNSVVRGVDPPRVDQLLSQGYGVFGHIQELLEENEKAFTDFIREFNRLLKDVNALLKAEDRKKLLSLIDNLNAVAIDVRGVTKNLNEPDTKQVFKLLGIIIRRAGELDGPALRKFLQEEGVRAHLF